MNIFGYKTGIDRALANKTHLTFHYVSRATRPDKIEVWLEGRLIYTFNWIDGIDAYPGSNLGKLFDVYSDYQKRNSIL